MPPRLCLLCTTPPASLGTALLATLCTCGQPLRLHAYGPPHGLSSRNCAGFQPYVALEAKEEAPVSQQLSLGEGV